jgi:crotonobetainyl-CoA:carnitine CoA-transferase CaiB-like acyl-CoA transferase
METLIRPIINAWLADKTKIEACELLMAQGLPCGPIQTSEEVAKCPHIAKRELFVKIPDPIMENLTVVGSPIKMEDHESSYGPLPNLGADTEAVLMEIGYGAEKIAQLRESKTI